jgi:glycosyltransferase involved in cell wall biosynthesis
LFSERGEIIPGYRFNLSLIVVARDEAKNIADCLGSVPFAKELLVVDNGSLDSTAEIARQMGAKIISVQDRLDFSQLKSLALGRASGDWVLSLDADERLSPELAREIAALLPTNPPHNGYTIPRKNFYLGKFLRFGGHFPDRQLRLMRRSKASLDGLPVHESFLVEGSVGRLQCPIIHNTYPTLSDYFHKQSVYVSLMADNLARRRTGKSFPARFYYLFLRPTWRFIRRYLFKCGFLSGYVGFISACLDAMTNISAYGEYLRRSASGKS